MQSDAQTVVDCVNSPAVNVVIESIAANCRMLLNKFKLGYVKFINRILNFGTHNLVGLGHSLSSRTWIGGVPIRTLL